jgi:hypothetical protein
VKWVNKGMGAFRDRWRLVIVIFVVLTTFSAWIIMARARMIIAEAEGNLMVFEPASVGTVTKKKERKTGKKDERPKTPKAADKNPAKAPSPPWGVKKILDPYRDMVFLTVVREGQFRELRDLVGSIHRWRPLASQHTPLIYVYGHRLQRREINEITLWRNVVFQDVKNILTPYSVYEGLQVMNKTEGLTSEMDKEIFTADGMQSLQATLISRVVQMHGHAVFLRIGNAIWQKTFAKLRDKLRTDGYLRLRSVYGEAIAEGYVAETEAFKCGIQAIWDPYSARGCAGWQGNVDSASDFSIDQVAPKDDDENVNMCHICIRDDAHHGWRLFKDHRPPVPPAKKPLRKMALGFPTTSSGVKNFWDLPFLGVFLPTLSRSLGWEDLRRYELSIYLGYDEGDAVYENRELMKRIVGKAKSTFRDLGIPAVQVNFVRLGMSKAVTYIWNVLFGIAISDGCDYFYQVNDDLRFSSFGWMHTFASQLDRQRGFGVVGPNDPVFDCKIMTMSMVTRLHWDIFGWYFPPEFRNWQCDTWISLVYSTYMKCFTRMVIWNGRYDGYLPRYQPCKKATFRPLTLHYQKRLKNSEGKIDPTMFPVIDPPEEEFE